MQKHKIPAVDVMIGDHIDIAGVDYLITRRYVTEPPPLSGRNVEIWMANPLLLDVRRPSIVLNLKDDTSVTVSRS